MTWIEQTFDRLETILITLNDGEYSTFYHRMYNEIYFEYKVNGVCNGIITGNTSIREVDKLISKLEQLNK